MGPEAGYSNQALKNIRLAARASDAGNDPLALSDSDSNNSNDLNFDTIWLQESVRVEGVDACRPRTSTLIWMTTYSVLSLAFAYRALSIGSTGNAAVFGEWLM